MRSAGLYILTGAPGSGKTAILDDLGSDIRCLGEPAREILEEQRSIDGAGTPDRDPSLFVDLLLRRSIAKHEAARRWDGKALFDRGVPDCVAYAALMGTDPAPSIRASEVYRYQREVLVLDAICRKLGFTLLGEVEFEVVRTPGSFMRCNDWRFDLFASSSAGRAEGDPSVEAQ